MFHQYWILKQSCLDSINLENTFAKQSKQWAHMFCLFLQSGISILLMKFDIFSLNNALAFNGRYEQMFGLVRKHLSASCIVHLEDTSLGYILDQSSCLACQNWVIDNPFWSLPGLSSNSSIRSVDHARNFSSRCYLGLPFSPLLITSCTFWLCTTLILNVFWHSNTIINTNKTSQHCKCKCSMKSKMLQHFVNGVFSN